MSVTISLVRHGQTVENTRNILQGQMPGILTPLGIEQARLLGEALAGKDLDLLLTSDLKRAIDTSQLINESLHLKIITDPMLRERDFGIYTGKPYGTHINREEPSLESVEQMFARASSWLERMRTDHNGKHILAVSHGLFLRVIQAAHYGKTIQEVFPMKNTETRTLVLD